MILAVDTETTGTDFFHGCRPFLLTACNGEEVFWEWGEVDPFTRNVHWGQRELSNITQMLGDYKTLVFHNAQFDMRALESIGIDISYLWSKVEDTNIAAHALHSAHYSDDGTKDSKKQNAGRKLGLKPLTMEYFGWDDSDEKELDKAVIAKRKEVEKLNYAIAKRGHPHFPAAKVNTKWYKMDMWLCPEECLHYAKQDAERTHLLWTTFKNALWDEGLMRGYKLRRELLPICYDISTEGIYVNQDGLNNYINSLDTKMTLIRKCLEKAMGIRYKADLSKPATVKLLVHDTLNIPVDLTTPNGSPQLNKEALASYAKRYPKKELKAFMKWKRWETKKRYGLQYVNHLYNQRIHSSCKITGTRNTRQSFVDPNIQNLDPILEEHLGPPPGFIWLEKDFKNIEMQIFGYSSGCKPLIELLSNGVDVHGYMMSKLYSSEYKRYLLNKDDPLLKRLRTKNKQGNFSFIYGGQPEKVNKTYGREHAFDLATKEFPGVLEYTQKLIDEVTLNREQELAPSVYTAYGYRLDVPLDKQYVACNVYCQGTAGIIMTKSMIATYKNPRYREFDCKMVSQVHDSDKIQIPFHDTIRTTVYSLIDSMETCVIDKLGRFMVDYKIKYNPADHHRIFKII